MTENKNKKFFITTAIDYVNAPPHVGHALEKIQTDAIARYHRLLGEEVLFLTGTDENSLKNVKAAEKEGIAITKLVERNSNHFYKLKEVLNLSFDDFIRTTEERHIKGVQKLWLACKKDIYKKAYKGLYCVGCEEFYKESELEDGLCPEHKVKPELVEEENYFFRLSKYQNQLKEIIEKDSNEDGLEIFPETRKNEVLSFINSGLEDICISRSSERAKGWGIPVPGDPEQIIWVWFDALSNYINALGYADNEEEFKKWWSGDVVHVIGKGILRFHAIYWPAILLSAKLPLPKKIFVHGYITVNNEKISKSLGNIVDPLKLVEKYGTDPVRYFLLREIPSTKDGDFTYDKLERRYNDDLAKGIGNLLARTLTMAEKYWLGIIPKIPKRTPEAFPLGKFTSGALIGNFREEIDKELDKSWSFIEDFSFHNSLFSITSSVFICDGYIDHHKLYKPSEMLKDKKENIDIVLYNVLEGIRHIAWRLLPFLPETAEKIFEQLGLDPKKEKERPFKEAIEWDGLPPGTKIKKGKSLFPRI